MLFDILFICRFSAQRLLRSKRLLSSSYLIIRTMDAKENLTVKCLKITVAKLREMGL